MKKIKVAVIGLGHAGEVFHLPGLSKFKDVELSICDINSERIEIIFSKFGINHEKCYQDYQELFRMEDPDAVLVLLPQYQLPGRNNDPRKYFQIIKETISQGRAVLVEKPLAMTLHEAQDLAEIAEKSGVVNMVSVNRRFNPLVQHCLKEVLKQGPVVNANCHFFKGHSHQHFNKGCLEWLTSDMIHALDLMRYFIGGEIKEFYPSMAKTESNDVPNVFHAMAVSDTGATGMFSSNVAVGGRVQSWEIHGIGISCFIRESFTLFNPTENDGFHMEATIIRRNENPYLASSEIIKDTDLTSHEFSAYAGFTAADRYFIDCVKSGTQTHCNFTDSVKTIYHCNQILKNKLNVI